MNLRIISKKGFRWSVGNGLSISFWFDNRIYDYSLADRCEVLGGSDSYLVSNFITQDRQWNLHLLVKFLPSHIINDIKGIYIPSNKKLDKLFWGPFLHGNCTVKLGLSLIQDINSQAYY